MKLLALIKYFRRHRDRFTRFLLALLGVVIALDTIPNLVNKEHAHTWAETNIPGFWAIFGLVGCILLILASKWFGHLGIMKREDYYDE